MANICNRVLYVKIHKKSDMANPPPPSGVTFTISQAKHYRPPGGLLLVRMKVCVAIFA